MTRIKYICRRNRLKSRWGNWIKYHLFRPLFLCCLERQEVRQSWDLVCESPLNPRTSHEHCKPTYALCSREYGTKEMHGNRTKFIITVIGKTLIIIKLFIIHLIKRNNNKRKKNSPKRNEIYHNIQGSVDYTTNPDTRYFLKPKRQEAKAIFIFGHENQGTDSNFTCIFIVFLEN